MKQLAPLERKRLIAKLFTRPVFTAMARNGSAAPILRRLKGLGFEVGGDQSKLGGIFDCCLNELSEAYRCEYVYKSALADRIVFGRHSPRTASMHVELPVGSSIVDVAVFNGTSTAYEIKTEFDSDKRLTSQSPDYLKVFDKVFVVTHPLLAARYAANVDPRVGILSLSERNQLSEVRPAQSDVSRIDPFSVFRMLRRDEYVSVVSKHFGPQPALPNGALFAHYEDLFVTLDRQTVHEAFVSAMRHRTTDAATVRFVSELPKSLRPLGYASPLSGTQRTTLLKVLA